MAHTEEAGTSTSVPATATATTASEPPAATTSSTTAEETASTTATSSTPGSTTSTPQTYGSSPTSQASETSETSQTSAEPSSTNVPTEPPGPQEPPYEDNTGYGIDLDPESGLGLLLIACAAGEPKHVTSPDFEILEGPYQEEQDGRYWSYLVQLRSGITFAENEVLGYWECDGDRPGGGATPVSPVPGSDDAGEWQDSNNGAAQVSFAPKRGVETGFGGSARD